MIELMLLCSFPRFDDRCLDRDVNFHTADTRLQQCAATLNAPLSFTTFTHEPRVTDPQRSLERFIKTMPHEYADNYSQKAIAQHHHIFQRRGDALVDVGIFEKRGDLTGIIVVAGDRQGLLALITEAFVVCGLDVVAGDAFTREDGALKEAIDLFWVRSANGTSIGEAEVNKLRATLFSLSEGYSTPVPTLVGTAPSGRSNSTVRFIEDKNGALSILEVETEDRSGLLLSLTRALHAQNVQILRSEVRTTAGRVFDRFVIAEPDGSPVSDLRRLEIQVAILSAAEPAKRLASSPPSPLQTA